MASGFHSPDFGKRSREIKVEYANIKVPAIRKRMVKRNKGSAERKPNLPAVDAEAHKKAKAIPIKMFFKDGNKIELI